MLHNPGSETTWIRKRRESRKILPRSLRNGTQAIDIFTPPQTRQDFERCFPDDDACHKYLARIRWPEGFACSACGSGQAWQTARGTLRCSRCQYQTSLTAGTIFEGTRKPIRQWLFCVWLVVSRKSGVSALTLQRELKLSSYQTAWTWLHKLRTAMSSASVQLAGNVQIDRIALGSPQDPLFRGRWKSEAVVMIATEVSGSVVGRMRMKLMTDPSPEEYADFFLNVLAPGATIETPFSSGLVTQEDLPVLFHELTSNRAALCESATLAGVNYVASALKRWLRRTYCAAVDLERLGFYLDEFTFRANFRRDIKGSEFFEILLRKAVQSRLPAPMKMMKTTKGLSVSAAG